MHSQIQAESRKRVVHVALYGLALLLLLSASQLAQAVSPDTPQLRYEVYSETAAELFWNRASDPDGLVLNYEIRVDGDLIDTVDALSYFWSDLEPGRVYEVAVTSVDNEGDKSQPAIIRFSSGEIPAGLRGDVYSSSAVEIFWNRSEKFGITYEVSRDGSVIRTTDGISHFDDALEAGTQYRYEVVSISPLGVRSSPATISLTTRSQTQPPSPAVEAPSGLTASVYSSSAAEIMWQRADTFGLTYEISRNGSVIRTTDGISHFDDDLSPDTRYTYDVVAISLSGQRSPASTIMLETPPGVITQPPVCKAISRMSDINTDETGRPVQPLGGINGHFLFQSYHVDEPRTRTWLVDTQGVSDGVTEVVDEILAGGMNFTTLDDYLYFSENDNILGRELWSYGLQGSVMASERVVDLFPGPQGSNPGWLTVFDNRLYFTADDDVHGTELWMYDPANTNTGAVLVADINPGSGSSSPAYLIPGDGYLAFFANDGNRGRAPYVYYPETGVQQAGRALPDIEGPPFGQPAIVDNMVYFRWWWPQEGGFLFGYDLGEAEGEMITVADVPELFTDDDTNDLIAFNGSLYFTFYAPGTGNELYQFDPAAADDGIVLAADINPGSNGSRQEYEEAYSLAMVALGGRLYMSADNGVHGEELVSFRDAAPDAGVALAADINTGAESSFPANLMAFEDKLYFSADDGVHGHQLWVYDPACQ